MEQLSIITQGMDHFQRALDAIRKKNLNQFEYNLRMAYDILPSGSSNFGINKNLQEIINSRELENIHSQYRFGQLDPLFLGYTQLILGNYEDSYRHLSEAIIYNHYSSKELPYLLRGELPLNTNPFKFYDITTALALRPSPRAYYLYCCLIEQEKKTNFKLKKGMHFEETIFRESSKRAIKHNNREFVLIFLNKVLESSDDPLVYLHRSRYNFPREKKDKDILKSYQIDPTNFETIKLAEKVYLKQNEYSKSLKCLLDLEKKGEKNFKAIGDRYYKLKNYDKAYFYYDLEGAENLAPKLFQNEIKSNNNQKNTAKEEEYYSEFFDPMFVISYLYPDSWHHSLINYFICVLIKTKSDFNLNTSNYYKLFIDLRDSFDQKMGKGKHSEADLQKKLSLKVITTDELYASRLVFYSMNHKIGFGIHSGKKIFQILKSNPELFVDYIINLKHFAIDPVIFVSSEIRNNPNFLKALEINLIKIKIISEEYYSKENESYDEYSFFSDENSYYEGGGGSEWSDPFLFNGG